MQDAYYSRTEVSNSDLSLLKQQLSAQISADPTQAFRFGSLLDALITEPDKLELQHQDPQEEPFTEEDIDRAHQMRRAFMRDELCRKMYLSSSFQKVMISQGKVFDYGPGFTLDVRCKWDLWMETLAWGADIKSTTATTEKQFREAVSYFDYDRQRYYYMNIAGSKKDLLIGISKVNYQVFKIPISWGDDLWVSGRDKTNELAFKYWLMFGA